MRFMWGPYNQETGEKCLTGCVMGIKMFLAAMELFNGPGAFARAKPVVLVIGRQKERVDARGQEVFLIGSCARAEVVKVKNVTAYTCFTPCAAMNLVWKQLGLRADKDGFAKMMGGMDGIFNELLMGRPIRPLS